MRRLSCLPLLPLVFTGACSVADAAPTIVDDSRDEPTQATQIVLAAFDVCVQACRRLDGDVPTDEICSNGVVGCANEALLKVPTLSEAHRECMQPAMQQLAHCVAACFANAAGSSCERTCVADATTPLDTCALAL